MDSKTLRKSGDDITTNPCSTKNRFTLEWTSDATKLAEYRACAFIGILFAPPVAAIGCSLERQNFDAAETIACHRLRRLRCKRKTKFIAPERTVNMMTCAPTNRTARRDAERVGAMNVSPGGPSLGRVVVVDDYEDSAEIACLLLEALGYEAHSGRCGRDALTLVGALDPEIVILDISLADMSGYEVARTLRARTNGHAVHLIALTGFGRPEDRVRALEAGFDQHIVKPLDLATLKRMVASTSTRRQELA